jgi:peptide/nickel transport system substrate-binding protein
MAMSMKSKKMTVSVIIAAIVALLAVSVHAADLRLGTSYELATLDPHFFASFPSGTSHGHIFDRLINLSESLKMQPGLIESWRNIDDTTWEFKLRKGVKFHDGSAFDAEDVIATMERIPEVKNSPNPFTRFVRRVVKVETPDPHTLIMKTKAPAPTLPYDLSSVCVISAEYKNATTKDFNDGKAAVGTGPYKLVEWKQGQALKLKRFEDYWGKKPAWEHVSEIPLPNASARMAALLSGDVDAINFVPVEDFDTVKKHKDFSLYQGPIARLHYIAMDSGRVPTPHVSAGGKNPLSDARVRKALSLALNRTAIVERLLLGLGTPASQLLPLSFAGSSKKLSVDPNNPEAAKKLLAEAGYPNGFELTFHATNGRYPADVEIAQACAQMWSRIGIKANVEALARTIFFPKATKYEFSIYTAQYGSNTNLDLAVSMLHTRIKEKGLGAGNRARYSNKEVDKHIDAALQEVDTEKSNALVSKAIEIAIGEHGLIPLYNPGFAVATKKGLHANIRADARNTAMQIEPAK